MKKRIKTLKHNFMPNFNEKYIFKILSKPCQKRNQKQTKINYS